MFGDGLQHGGDGPGVPAQNQPYSRTLDARNLSQNGGFMLQCGLPGHKLYCKKTFENCNKALFVEEMLEQCYDDEVPIFD